MYELLRLLADGRFHSGEELGAVLGMSRSAVWKHARRLESQLGIALFKVPGKGYRLAGPLSLLSQEALSDVMNSLGWRLFLHDSVDSTNAEALRLLQSGVLAPLVVMAEGQTGGRGRRGRAWVSPPAENIYFTLCVKITNGAQGLSGLSLVTGLAVLQALRNIGVEDVGLKWPNDIYAGGKKIAGILLELTGDPADVCHVAIGIGVNVNMISDAVDIDQPWTSIRAQLAKLVDRVGVALLIAESLHRYLERHAYAGFASLRDEWEANDLWKGRRCTLSTGTRQIKGVMMGVNKLGELRLLVDGEGEQHFSGGELSLRLNHDS
ncbi:bifunctional biotin--[acetyl-CoA-carboxylase] ligase/biotin operon repressor BirA [Pseudomonas sp. DNDY-54]|uniref:bifunctional biotin--[acetyl-CoA-carboxylase] ligase/biotin operon repressor BirA n=1 Tax=Pseudomonas sp. DNDY-54 TaxID=2870860 RepID=UPI001CA46828|nr:bifunctional biotin--[acetyl-CoA-carboxylase] ligase/biotin operon repressor BirA [Pseudomonas sp. DNDY-54]